MIFHWPLNQVFKKQELPPRQDKMLKLNCNKLLSEKIEYKRDSALLQK